MPVVRGSRRRPRAAAGRIAAAALLALAVAAAAATVAAMLWLIPGAETSRDGNPCPGWPVADSAILLLDLRKPISSGRAGAIVRDVSLRMDARAGLRVYALADDQRAPRRLLGRLCRPYDHEALRVTAAKDGSNTVRDCDDLPAQIPPGLRTAATRYCAQRAELAGRADALVASGGAVANAYLMEAIEESVRELEGWAVPRALFVFSDMVQHAPWYSHLDLDWSEWGFDDFMPVMAAHDPSFLTRRPGELEVSLLYMPKEGLTDDRRVKDAHWSFWRHYFFDATVAFEEHEAVRSYAAPELMDLGVATRDVSRERSALSRRLKDAEDALRVVREQTRALTAERRELGAANDTRTERIADLRRQRTTLRTERLQLQREWDMPLAFATEPPAPAAAPALEPVVPTLSAVAPCQLRLLPAFDAALAAERYLDERTANYGAGTVVMHYAVTAEGATIGDAVLNQERSSATRPQHLAVLAADALGVVRDWKFAVQCGPNAKVGAQGQWASATFTYREKCVGSPIPRCRTAFARAAP